LRNFSATALNAMNALDGAGDTFLWLARISHPQMTTIDIVNNNVDVLSNSVNYTAYAFGIIVNDDNGDRIPELKLTVDNVDRMLVDEIRTLPSAMTVDLQLVLASDPDVVEMEFPSMTLRRVNYNATTITGTLVVSEMLSIRFPKGKITAENYAGIF